MIAFPLTIDGTVRIDIPEVVTLPEKAALTALESGLERVRASRIWREETRLDFTVSLFRWWVTDWNLLKGVWSGSIDVAAAEGKLAIRFSLKSFDFLFFALLAVLLSIARGGVTEVAIIWLSIGALAYLVRWLRFRSFVRRCVGDAFDEWVAMAKIA